MVCRDKNLWRKKLKHSLIVGALCLGGIQSNCYGVLQPYLSEDIVVPQATLLESAQALADSFWDDVFAINSAEETKMFENTLSELMVRMIAAELNVSEAWQSIQKPATTTDAPKERFFLPKAHHNPSQSVQTQVIPPQKLPSDLACFVLKEVRRALLLWIEEVHKKEEAFHALLNSKVQDIENLQTFFKNADNLTKEETKEEHACFESGLHHRISLAHGVPRIPTDLSLKALQKADEDFFAKITKELEDTLKKRFGEFLRATSEKRDSAEEGFIENLAETGNKFFPEVLTAIGNAVQRFIASFAVHVDAHQKDAHNKINKNVQALKTSIKVHESDIETLLKNLLGCLGAVSGQIIASSAVG